MNKYNLVSSSIVFVAVLGLSCSAVIFQSASNPIEKFVFENDENVNNPLSSSWSEQEERKPEYFVPSAEVREMFEKDDQELMERIAQLFNNEFRYERDPDSDQEETSSRISRSAYQQQNQDFANYGSGVIPGSNRRGNYEGQSQIQTGGGRIPVAPIPGSLYPGGNGGFQIQTGGGRIPAVPLPGSLYPGGNGGQYQIQTGGGRITSGSLNQGGNLGCPQPNGYFPVPGDCRSFIHCDRGTPFKKQCGPGTVWNQNLLVCSWPTGRNDCGADYSRQVPQQPQQPQQPLQPNQGLQHIKYGFE